MSVERARADLERLEQAANQLRAKLAENEERAAKVRIYLEMTSIYGAPEAPRPAESAAKTQASPTNGAAPPKNKGGRPRGEGGGIVERAQKGSQNFLRASGRPMMTRELLQMLENQGTQIGGNSPTSNLSGMLSRSPLFKSSKDGWTLAEWESPATSNAGPNFYGDKVSSISEDSA